MRISDWSSGLCSSDLNGNSPVLDGKLRSPHAVELPFVFDNVDVSAGLVGAGESQDKMAKLMSKTFAAFARSGNPNIEGVPHWPTYEPVKSETFIYDIDRKSTRLNTSQ